MVSRFAGCLGELPARQRKVLRLRAGIGGQPVSTRRRVGLRLDFSAARVARIERRGLRGLRKLDSDNGGCGAATATAASAGTTEATGVTGTSGTTGTASASASGTAVGAAVTGEQTGSRSSVASAVDNQKGGQSRAVVLPPQEQASDWSIAAVLVGVLLLGYALRREFGPSGPSHGRVWR